MTLLVEASGIYEQEARHILLPGKLFQCHGV
jgi:hypothetical protein